jgi:trehalose 6-phosphate synthase/phosphatase
MSSNGHATQRIIIVSNRLPFTVEQKNGQIEFIESVGGVASGLKSLLETTHETTPGGPEYLWVGWPGGTVSDEQRAAVQCRARSDYHCCPVFLSGEDIEKFYEGFCNKTIWPLFHYFTANAHYNQNYWLQYKKVNEAFCATLLEIVGPDDVLWIHDYHLMLLPKLIRERYARCNIGFFLHIPFPQFEIYRLLPAQWRREIIEGLLGADVVGFHTHDYEKYFLGCVQRILGCKHKIGQVSLDRRIVKVRTFPMGVDFRRFQRAALSQAVQKEKERLQKIFGQTKIVLSVDRQDYSKGIIHRLEGYETLLESRRQWRERVTLLMIVVPSRIGIQDYQETKNHLEELVGKINGKFGTLNWAPIVYQYRTVPFETLVALYALSDVALVTPLRDGMNLIAKEYVASRTDKTGVLILSEMAGCAQELSGAILINPNHREEIADALSSALAMPSHEQERRNRVLQTRLRRHDIRRWTAEFIGEIFSHYPIRQRAFPKPLTPAAQTGLIHHYDRSLNRLLLLDYDGTLVEFAKYPQLAKPNRRLLNSLHALGANPRNELVLLSGRDRATIAAWFGSLPIGLAAEHGAWIKEREKPWETIEPVCVEWKPRLLPILKTYADRVPGAWIEEKEFSLVLHYRTADEQLGALAARELTDHLLVLTANTDVQILQGNKTVEIRTVGIHKGMVIQRWLLNCSSDFILAIGDDLTDEDMFKVLPARSHSIRVGIGPTCAHYYLHGPHEVIRLLDALQRGEHIEKPARDEAHWH